MSALSKQKKSIIEQKELIINLIKKLNRHPGDSIQRKIAPLLRAIAMDYIQQGGKLSSPISAKQTSFDIKKQRQNGTFATDHELEALCRIFGLNYSLTARDDQPDRFQYQVELFPSPDTPSIAIRHSRGHFYRERYSDTIGDGNCLYNAFAYYLHKLYNMNFKAGKSADQLPTAPAEKTVQRLSSLNQSNSIERKSRAKENNLLQTTQEITPASVREANASTFENSAKSGRIESKKIEQKTKSVVFSNGVDSQYKRWKEIISSQSQFKFFDGVDLSASTKKEQQRISSLSSSEQEQIKNDYQLALSIAKDEEVEHLTPSAKL